MLWIQQHKNGQRCPASFQTGTKYSRWVTSWNLKKICCKRLRHHSWTIPEAFNAKDQQCRLWQDKRWCRPVCPGRRCVKDLGTWIFPGSRWKIKVSGQGVTRVRYSIHNRILESLVNKEFVLTVALVTIVIKLSKNNGQERWGNTGTGQRRRF